MAKPQEQLTYLDFVRLYGKEYTNVAKAFGLHKAPFTLPHKYKRMMEVVLHLQGSRKGKNKYVETLEIYNQDILERFEEVIGTVEYLVQQSQSFITALMLDHTKSGFMICDNYSKIFSKDGLKRVFSQEALLQKTLKGIFELDDLFSVTTEKNVSNGTIDLYYEGEGEVGVIELKKDKAKRKDLYQVFDYSLSEEIKGKKSRVVLIASSFSEDVLELAEILQIECLEYQIAFNDNDPDMVLCLEPLNVLKSALFEEYLTYGDFWFSHPNFVMDNQKYYQKKVQEFNRDVDILSSILSELTQERSLMRQHQTKSSVDL